MLRRLRDLCVIHKRRSKSTAAPQEPLEHDDKHLYHSSRDSIARASEPPAPPQPEPEPVPEPTNETDTPLQPFRLYDLPLELRTHIFELYALDLYPGIISQCLCSTCKSTTRLATTMRRQVYKPRRTEHGSSGEYRFRFSYCEARTPAKACRSTGRRRGWDFDSAFNAEFDPDSEPGVFVASKAMRADVIDAVVRTRPMYVCRMGRPRWPWTAFSCCDAKVVPAWYRRKVRVVMELRPAVGWLMPWPRSWSWNYTGLEELRLNCGRVRMGFGVEAEGRLEWTEGLHRDRVEEMVRRRVDVKMRRILRLIGDDASFTMYRKYKWGNEMVPTERRIEKRNWKVVLFTEFWLKVREDRLGKRSWASIYVTAREGKGQTYSLELEFDDHLRALENNSPPCWCFVAPLGADIG